MKILVTACLITFCSVFISSNCYATNSEYYLNQMNIAHVLDQHTKRILPALKNRDETVTALLVNTIGHMLRTENEHLMYGTLYLVKDVLIHNPKFQITWFAGDEEAFLAFKANLQSFYIVIAESQVVDKQANKEKIIRSLSDYIKIEKDAQLRSVAIETKRAYEKTIIKVEKYE